VTAAAYPARLYDGASPQSHACIAHLQPDGLRLSAADPAARSSDLRLAYRDLRLLDSDRSSLRLGLAGTPELRVIIPVEARAALHALAPQILDQNGARRRMLALVGGLTAAGAAVVAALFFGAPIAAEPLARATPLAVEEKLGANVLAQATLALPRCEGNAARRAEALLAPIAHQAAGRLHARFVPDVTLVRSREPNALALPGGHILITRGLVERLNAPDQLAAVVAHEAGHVAARDGMVALYRHAGLGLLLELVTGGSGVAQQIVILSAQLSELRHSREQEDRADRAATDALAAMGQDPAALGRALRNISAAPPEPGATPRLRLPEWLASHSDTKARIARAEALARPPGPALFDAAAWQAIKSSCDAEPDASSDDQ